MGLLNLDLRHFDHFLHSANLWHLHTAETRCRNQQDQKTLRRSYVSQSQFQAELGSRMTATAPRRSAPAPVPAESPKSGPSHRNHELSCGNHRSPVLLPELSVRSLPRLQQLQHATSETGSHRGKMQKYVSEELRPRQLPESRSLGQF